MSLKAVEEKTLQLDQTQVEAVELCLGKNRIVPITGAAGTGKTTIIKHVYHALRDRNKEVAICAPTGKAAKRMQEATGIVAFTIHRLLKYPFPHEIDEETGKALKQGLPSHRKDNPMPWDVVIADEYAMINREVHRNLMDALKKGARVLMFGDVNQLQPIERNKVHDESPFKESLRKFQHVVLARVHRHEEGSGIADNGSLILKGRIPRRRDDFQLLLTEHPVEMLREHMINELRHEHKSFGVISNQIITLAKKGWIGTYQLNQTLQYIFNPNPESLPLHLPRHKWEKKLPVTVFEGDKVQWTENAYDLRNHWEIKQKDEYGRWHITAPPMNRVIMNGETGIITQIFDDGGLLLDVGDRMVEVPSIIHANGVHGKIQYDPRRALDLAYVITTHKSQGSEYTNVVYVMNKSNGFMQCRSNFYTAVTRARKHVTVVSDQKSLANSVFMIKTRIESRSGR